jgi:hypothetical protein
MEPAILARERPRGCKETVRADAKHLGRVAAPDGAEMPGKMDRRKNGNALANALGALKSTFSQ